MGIFAAVMRWSVKARYNLVLQHLCDQRLCLVRTDSETAEGERPIAILQHRFKLLQTFKVGPSPKQANWNFIAPLQTLVQGSMEIVWLITALLQDFDARVEPLIGVILIVSHARAENINQ